MPRPSLSPLGSRKRYHIAVPPELVEIADALADEGKLSEACCQGIKNYQE